MIAHVHREDFSFRVPIIQIDLFKRLAPTVLNVSKVRKAARTNCQTNFKAKKRSTIFVIAKSLLPKRDLILLWVRIEEKIVYQSWHHFRREESKKTRATHTMEKYNFLEPIIHSQIILFSDFARF